MQEATEFAKQVDHPNIRTMADTYHINFDTFDESIEHMTNDLKVIRDITE